MTETPWLDRAEYPFAPHHFESGDGRMHYVDEGEGEPVVLVHGTPTWSFLYSRHRIRGLSRTRRVIAPGHLGFGLSEKPADALYRPEDHARRLEALLEHLGLEGITLVVHDFGGPIGLSYALRHPASAPARPLQHLDVVARRRSVGGARQPAARRPRGTLPVHAAQLLAAGADSRADGREKQALPGGAPALHGCLPLREGAGGALGVRP